MQVVPRGRVLVVDDNERAVNGLCEHLNEYLLQTQTADCAQEALRELALDRFDVIVLDWILPDGDGRSVLEFASRVSPETATIVYSAHRSSDTECTAARAHHFVQKSHDTSHIRNAVERALEQRRQPREVCSGSLPPPKVKRDSFWKILHEFLPPLPADCSKFVVNASDRVLARGYAEWLCAQIDETCPYFEIDCRQLAAAGNAESLLFGECTTIGHRRPTLSRGWLDAPWPRHVVVHDAQYLDAELLQHLVETIKVRTFRRVGSDRELELRDWISFTVTNGSKSVVQVLNPEKTLHEVLIPECPLAIVEASIWVNKILGSAYCNQSDRGSNTLPLLDQLHSAITWGSLLTLSDIVDASDVVDLDWMTALPFYESTFAGKGTGQVTRWKEISQTPRLIYVAWLLKQTGGNVAEAARLSGLTRPAIYSTIQSGKIELDEARRSLPVP